MATQTLTNRVRVIGLESQATGTFDGGRITEFKPIGFAGEGSAVDRVGPLFYWAWATADGYGKIGMHPHYGFEILSYVVEGELGHRDSLGTESRVGAGGVQVIQAGSGIAHEEQMLGDRTAFFQIWFEPDLRAALKRPPAYRDFDAGAFPVLHSDGVTVRELLGGNSPLTLATDAHIDHIKIEHDAHHAIWSCNGRSQATVVMSGHGSIVDGADEQPIQRGDFVVTECGELRFENSSAEPLELMLIDVPTTPDYPLHRKL